MRVRRRQQLRSHDDDAGDDAGGGTSTNYLRCFNVCVIYMVYLDATSVNVGNVGSSWTCCRACVEASTYIDT